MRELDSRFWRKVAAAVIADGAIDAEDAERILRAVAGALREAGADLPIWRRTILTAAAAGLDDLAAAIQGIVQRAAAEAAEAIKRD